MAETSFLIVGLGRGAAWGREIRKDPALRIAGLVDVDPAKLAAVGAELGVPEAYRFHDYQVGLREAGADIAVLAVPTPLHRAMILDGLRAGHHVICEKPLAMNLAEARELREAVKQFDRRFMVGEQYRFADGMENLRRAIVDGMIGRIAYISHEFFRGTQLGPGRVGQPDHWYQAYQEAALHDMSVHHFDMWYYLTGSRCREIYVKPFDAPGHQSGRKFGYSVLATLADGTHVDYLTCRALARPQTPWYGTLWIVGDNGALFWDGESSSVRLTRAVPATTPSDQQLAAESIAAVDRGINGTNGPLRPMIHALLEAIRANRPHPCDIDDNFASFATSMAAIESVQTGQPAKVATP